jgi:SAM-dependent methyltransferase
MQDVKTEYRDRDFWIKENLNYAKVHFRLEKLARMINTLAGDKEQDLLDIGCGPASLRQVLQANIHYHGIDIAIHDPAPDLVQADFVESPIAFGNKRFDIIVAQGVFEYVGSVQAQKFSEIQGILKDEGTFIASYVNFNHRDVRIFPAYNNIQSVDEFQRALASWFDIIRCFPTSHHWHHHEPTRRYMKRLQMNMTAMIPVVSRTLAVEYCFVCSLPGSKRAARRQERLPG